MRLLPWYQLLGECASQDAQAVGLYLFPSNLWTAHQQTTRQVV